MLGIPGHIWILIGGAVILLSGSAVAIIWDFHDERAGKKGPPPTHRGDT